MFKILNSLVEKITKSNISWGFYEDGMTFSRGAIAPPGAALVHKHSQSVRLTVSGAF